MTNYNAQIIRPLVIAFEGTVDNVTAQEFANDLLSAVGQENVSSLIVDLTKITFINSLGIGGLIKLKNVAAEKDVELRILVGEEVADVLKIAKLGYVFPVELATPVN